MSNPIIQVENLSKRYRIGLSEKAYRTFREAVTDVFTAPLRNFNRLRKLNKFDDSPGTQKDQSNLIDQPGLSESSDIIWALKNISFQVHQGEVVGIIGRNGAGKSTLLKILSRITEPTSGEIRLHGRIASLLEVGTGFHPELTGRENIYLNGTILGMKTGEINRNFDEIVAFSEIEKFLDTPVKRYSSGMYVRLAFAVAAHLEPEILLIDEVLAVGDAAFQKKCLGKMGDVAKEGRTVLFVSHNMTAVQSLCTRSLLIESGGLHFDGPTGETIAHYRETSSSLSSLPIAERSDRKGKGPVRFTDVTFESEKGKPIQEWPCGDSGFVILHYESSASSDISNIDLGFSVASTNGQQLFQCFTRLAPDWQRTIPPKGAIRCYITSLNIKPGLYFLNLYAETGSQPSDWIQEAVPLLVGENDFFGSGKLPEHSSFMLIPQQWSIDS